MDKVKIVIMAAGKGKRMGGDLPKVLEPLLGQPMISRLLEHIAKAKIDPQPVIIVGHKAELVQKALGSSYIYVRQEELLGTGHAVQQTKTLLQGRAENILVLNGDHPVISATSINKLVETHLRSKTAMTLATATVPDFQEWRAAFKDFGRIVRDGKGNFKGIVEAKDATPEELLIKEVNPAMYCFTEPWLWPHLDKIKNKNVQGEYYLTDLLGIAIQERQPVATVTIDPKECIGINTKEQLAIAEELYSRE